MPYGVPDVVGAADAVRADVVLVARDLLQRFDEDGFDTVACNVRFDESRMFEFLQALMDRRRVARIVAFRVGETVMAPASRNAIRNALEALGVEHFIDLIQIGDEYGDDVALETLRKMILDESFAPPSPPEK